MDQEKGERLLAYLLHGMDHAEALLAVVEPDMLKDPGHRRLLKVLKKAYSATSTWPTLREAVSLVRAEAEKEGTFGIVVDAIALEVQHCYELVVTENTWQDIQLDVIRGIGAELAPICATADGETIVKRAGDVAGNLSALTTPTAFKEEPAKDFFIPEYLDAHLEALANPDLSRRIHFGYPCFDSVVRGLMPGEMAFVVASSGSGKTMALGNIAQNIAEQGQSALYCDAEGCEAIIRDRWYARITGIPINSYEARHVVEGQRGNLLAWKDKQPGCLRYQQIMKGTTVSGLSKKVGEYKKKYGLDVLVFDYGELLVPDKTRTEERHNQKAAFDGLWSIAAQHGIVVITATQGNRSKLEAMKQRDTSMEIDLADLNECYAKAFCASAVLGFYQIKPDISRGLIRGKVLKNRKGPASMVYAFDQRFEIGLLQESCEMLDGGSVSPRMSPQAAAVPVNSLPLGGLSGLTPYRAGEVSGGAVLAPVVSFAPLDMSGLMPAVEKVGGFYGENGKGNGKSRWRGSLV